MTSLNSICLEWNNLNYTVSKKKFNFRKCKTTVEQLNVLKDASGHVESGNLVAILGPSGAGKTTLLAAISHRIRGQIAGSISINGFAVSRQQLVRQSSFVPQFDITADGLTAREHLYFMCQLRMDRYLPNAEKRHRIDGILWQLGLMKVADLQIIRMSGGERKKLNLATELLTDPEIIFCDEPTTGLDSFSALSVVQSLKSLTQNGKPTNRFRRNELSPTSALDSVEMEIVSQPDEYTLLESDCIGNKAVICSIHQPTSAVFECFTHVIIMNGGRISFQGTVEQASNFFTRIGHKCPNAYNPAEFYIKLISDNEICAKITALREASSVVVTEKRTYGRQISYREDVKRVCWIYQMYIIMCRSGVESKRTKWEFFLKLITFLVTAICIGVLYAATTVDRQRSIQDINGFTFMLVAQVIFATAYNVIFYYPSKLPILRREAGESMYNLSAYYVATFLSSIPRSLIECTFFMAIIYPWLQFANGWLLFVEIVLTLTMATVPATAYGLMLSGMFESSQLTTELAPPFDVLFCLLAGVYVRWDLMWYVKYFSLFFYSNEAISVLMWRDVQTLDCADSTDGFCLKNGKEVLESLDYGTGSYLTILFDVFGMMLVAAVMHLIGYFGVRRMVTRAGYY